MKIILLGTVSPYRGGGLSTFNERLALEFLNSGHDFQVFNFKLQYPELLFPGKFQYLDNPPPLNFPMQRKINSVNPLNWVRVGMELFRLKPDIIIFRYWISFMAPCFFVIAYLTRRNKHTKVLTIVDNAISHEPKFYEIPLAKIFFSACDYFIVMSEKVRNDLAGIFSKNSLMVFHPLYDNYSPAIDKGRARSILNIAQDDKVILFFGFIREYKGLDLLLEALADPEIKSRNIKLLLAGEFYEDKEKYYALVSKLKIEDRILWHTEFIPDEDIVNYFCAADAVILPYRSATQSGVTQVAYFYHTPVLATNVGGIKELIINGVHGLIVEPNPLSIARGILKFYNEDLEETFRRNLAKDKAKYTWDKFVGRILEYAHA